MCCALRSSMVSLCIPMCVRFGRLMAENVVNTGKSGSSRCEIHKSLMNNWLGDWRGMSVASKETRQNAETTPNEESENEKKLRTENENLTKEIVLLSEQKLELEDKYKRALADSENMRRRLMKQIEDAKLFGIQAFCKDLLEVADILGKATESVPKEEVRESNPHLKNLYEGLTMTEAQLHKVFMRHGLIPVNPIEETFDPNVHEALFQQEVQGKAPGTIVVVSKIGYKLHDRVIRPALVGVAKGP